MSEKKSIINIRVEMGFCLPKMRNIQIILQNNESPSVFGFSLVFLHPAQDRGLISYPPTGEKNKRLFP